MHPVQILEQLELQVAEPGVLAASIHCLVQQNFLLGVVEEKKYMYPNCFQVLGLGGQLGRPYLYSKSVLTLEFQG